MPQHKRREMLRSLGYDWHDGLIDGRVNNAVLPDAGKPRLYIKKDDPQGQIVGAGEIARAYSEAQK